MGNKNKYTILRRPIITEKSLQMVDELNQYCFEVSLEATKDEVKKAIEEKFNVEVLKVRTLNVRGDLVEWGQKRIKGSRRDTKKAIVTLKSSDSIDIFKVT